jgi:hypothetical protein
MDVLYFGGMVLKMVVEKVSVKAPSKETMKVGERGALGIEKAYA